MSGWSVPGYADGRELGVNAHGRTVLARHAPTGVRVAIRYLAEELRRDEEYLNRYRAEARVLAGLTSPHVTALYEYVEADPGVATVREYVHGTSLRVLLSTQRRMRPDVALTVLKGGLLGLRAAHALGAVHGGYRPENLLVSLTGEVKVCDFDGPADGSVAGDLTAAMATFVECLTGVRPSDLTDSSVPAGVPGRLRGLVLAAGSAEADADTLLTELEAVARKACGESWQARGQQRLARRTVRQAGRRTSSPG